MNKKTTFWFAIFGALLFIVSSFLGGLQFENYSHIKQFISESYAVDAPYGMYLSLFGFIPSGILITIFSFSALKYFKQSRLIRVGLIWFGIFYGIGTIVVSIFPCDSGCNKALINPSISQVIHNIIGAITYLVVPISLILIGLGLRKLKTGKVISILSICCSGIAILFTYLISTNASVDFNGLFQRIVEGSILFWLINFAYYFKKQDLV
ncbi:DUF998 domain-containing protein [Flavobacteriaceae bacterium LMO-SS05]